MAAPGTPSTSVWDNLLQGQNNQEMLRDSHVCHLTYLYVDNSIMTRQIVFSTPIIQEMLKKTFYGISIQNDCIEKFEVSF